MSRIESNSYVGEKVQLATFLVENLYFGINVMQVQEVIHYEQPTPVPLAPNDVAGLINLRGLIITAIDLRKLLKKSARPENSDPKIVVTHCGNETIGLIVDHIRDVVELDSKSHEKVPASLDAGLKSLVKGVYKQDKLLLEIKPEAFLSH